jgi:Cu+-exporting ATPase
MVHTQAPIIKTQCFHCGDICENENIQLSDKTFCCEGCKMVYEILNTADLGQYYKWEEKTPGISQKGKFFDSFQWMDKEEVKRKLLDFSDGKTAKITFRLPQIHCASCIWLLENLYRLNKGILESRVDFLQKKCYITFREEEITLNQLTTLLAKIGYEPDIRLEDLSQKNTNSSTQTLIYRIAISGFCFGNVMLLSFPEYLGQLAEEYKQFFGIINLILSLPIVLFSAIPYYQSAYYALKQKQLNMDVPIVLGIIALFGRSWFEVLSHTGAGYTDSLAGLLFFLLLGKWFQQKTYDRLSFEREYESYFPIAVLRKGQNNENERVTLPELREGDTLFIKNGELIPADSILLNGEAKIDYSFVTGEAEPIEKKSGELIYAGGRQVGSTIELTLVKKVSQSYLTELWNHAAFNKHADNAESLTQELGKRFTVTVLIIAAIATTFWAYTSGFHKAIDVFTAILIVACPCALALTVPLTLGNALRILGRRHFYLKNTQVLESIAKITHIVFDKTGTLTYKHNSIPNYSGEPLAEENIAEIRSLVTESLHPISISIAEWAGKGEVFKVENYQEIIGKGIVGIVNGNKIKIGSAAFFANQTLSAGKTYLAINNKIVGNFVTPDTFRVGLKPLIQHLANKFGISLLSGDNEKEKTILQTIFPTNATMRFQQTPFDKLHYIENQQDKGEKVLMIGDGLNDAGALKQANVGISIAENVHQFSPACDAILDASEFSRLDDYILYAAKSVKLVKYGYFVSLAYNITGLAIAIQGLLSPVLAAILMPLSSFTILTFSTLSTWWVARKMKI